MGKVDDIYNAIDINKLLAEAGFVFFSEEEDPNTPIDWSSDYTKEIETFAKLLIKELQ